MEIKNPVNFEKVSDFEMFLDILSSYEFYAKNSIMPTEIILFDNEEYKVTVYDVEMLHHIAAKFGFKIEILRKEKENGKG